MGYLVSADCCDVAMARPVSVHTSEIQTCLDNYYYKFYMHDQISKCVSDISLREIDGDCYHSID